MLKFWILVFVALLFPHKALAAVELFIKDPVISGLEVTVQASISASPSLRPSIKPNPSPTPILDASEEGTIAGTSTEINLEGFGSSATPQSSSHNEERGSLSLNKKRAKTTIVVGLGLIIISLASFFGYTKYLSLKKKTEDRSA